MDRSANNSTRAADEDDVALIAMPSFVAVWRPEGFRGWPGMRNFGRYRLRSPLATVAARYPDRDRVFPGRFIRLDDATKSLAHSRPRARDGSTVVTTTISCDAAARIEIE